MTNEKSINWLTVIAPAILGSIVGACFGVGLGYVISTQPDFALSVQPLLLVAPAPSDVMANITIMDLHRRLHKYQNQIILMARVMNNSSISDSEITFDPLGFDPLVSGSSIYKSRMKIVLDRDVKPGSYSVRILALGGDGKERSCIISLKIIK